MKQKARILFVWMIIFAVLGMFFAGMGFHKMFVYENSEYSWRENKNAYVGGDAYNYIINGTYFAGYSALSGAMFICACMCGIYKSKAEDFDKLLGSQEEIKQNIKIVCTYKPTKAENGQGEKLTANDFPPVETTDVKE